MSAKLSKRAAALAERIPYSVIALASRIAVADMFWRSGQTKVNGFSIREETFYLFREEYKVPLLPPDLAAYLSTIGEHVFPVLLFVGLASRLSALGLFGMTMVIQLFVVPGGWPEHILWFSLLDLDHRARARRDLARSSDLEQPAGDAGDGAAKRARLTRRRSTRPPVATAFGGLLSCARRCPRAIGSREQR